METTYPEHTGQTEPGHSGVRPGTGDTQGRRGHDGETDAQSLSQDRTDTNPSDPGAQFHSGQVKSRG